MMNRIVMLTIAVVMMAIFSGTGYSEDKEVLGVNFPGEKVVAGKTLKLNGVAYKKVFFIKVYAGGFYLENPTQDPKEIIESEQVKHFHLQYLTEQATAKKLQEGFIELMEECNPPELVKAHRANI